MSTAALRPGLVAPARHDRVALAAAGCALAALLVLPWGMEGGPSALRLAADGAAPLWLLIALTGGTLALAWLDRAGATALRRRGR